LHDLEKHGVQDYQRVLYGTTLHGFWKLICGKPLDYDTSVADVEQEQRFNYSPTAAKETQVVLAHLTTTFS